MSIKSRFQKYLSNIALKGLSENFGTPEMIRAIYEFYGDGTRFITDNTTYQPIREGYEKSPTVFGVVDKISTYFASINYIPYKIGTEEVSKYDPLKELFGSNSVDLRFYEFKKLWELFGLIYGNGIVHTPKFKYGNNSGEIMKMAILPVQNIEIESGSLGNIVKSYRFTMGDANIFINPDEVWHSRMFLNLDFDNGKNLMGISPIKIAAKIIESQNNADNLRNATYKNPLPPAILANKTKTSDLTKQEQTTIDKAWDRRIKGRGASRPMFVNGDIQLLKLGYDNYKDLDIIENSRDGLRTFCNVLSVPSSLFNDHADSALNSGSKKESSTDMYEGRVLPDVQMFQEGVNMLFEPTGVEYRADLSKIAALQQDLKEKAVIYDMGIKNRSVLPNEYRKDVLGKDELTPEELQELQMQAEFNNLPNNNMLENNQL